MARQYSAWEIGRLYYDQTDLYTRGASIDDRGYGRGPSRHPPEGSYAYSREAKDHAKAALISPPLRTDATLYEREAWPWLNYHGLHDDPYFAHLEHEHDHAKHRREGKTRFAMLREALLSFMGHEQEWQRQDKRISRDVDRAFDFRADLDTTDIRITVHRARVTLAGTVPDERAKRLAAETAAGIRGVREVHNRLTVRHDDPTDANVVFVLPLSLSAFSF